MKIYTFKLINIDRSEVEKLGVRAKNPLPRRRSRSFLRMKKVKKKK